LWIVDDATWTCAWNDRLQLADLTILEGIGRTAKGIGKAAGEGELVPWEMPRFSSRLRLDVLEPLSVHARRAPIGLAAGVGVLQYVCSVQLVVQCIEPKAWVILRFGMQRRL